jgi:sterol 3beta-glucosyltransferase
LLISRLVYRSYNTDVDRWDPVTGGASSVVGTLTDMTVALGQTFIDPYKEYKQHRLQTADQQQGSVGGAVGSATMASGKGLGRLYGAMAKGALVDLPLALTEGLRNAPRLYGAEADDYGRAKDWKSGCVVGGKVGSDISTCNFHL